MAMVASVHNMSLVSRTDLHWNWSFILGQGGAGHQARVLHTYQHQAHVYQDDSAITATSTVVRLRLVLPNLHVRFPKKITGQPAALQCSILATNYFTRHLRAPLIDRAHGQTEHVSGLVSNLITYQTGQITGDSAVVNSVAL